MGEIGDFLVNPTVLAAVFLGGSALLLGYILKLFRNYQHDEENVKSERVSTHSDRKKEQYPASKNKKKSESRYRGDKQGFKSPWVLTSLKGHTGAILDVDYSSNGKYLASCGEEDPDPDPFDADMSSNVSDAGSVMSSSSSTSSLDGGSNKENSRPTTDQGQRLTRRQRKNRRRDDASPHEKKTLTFVNSALKAKKTEPVERDQHRALSVPKENGVELSPNALARHLYQRTLSKSEMFASGYPVQTENGLVVFNHVEYNPKPNKFDVNAREFVPKGQRKSESGSDSESSGSEDNSLLKISHPFAGLGVERQCARCSKGFFVTECDYLTHERCLYHWGKLHNVTRHDRDHGCYKSREFTCCNGAENSTGCAQSKLHVWTGAIAGINGPCDGYVRTRARRRSGATGVYALDCEMCFTVAGLELTKVTVVGIDGRVVYDSYVKPTNEIVDYNTRFSGITEADLNGANAVKTLKEVQEDLRLFVGADTILVGHGLENDLRALKLLHENCVDTAVAFPHSYGLPFKRSLRSLVGVVLDRQIQTGCHDSYEDACASMELILAVIAKDLKKADKVMPNRFYYC